MGILYKLKSIVGVGYSKIQLRFAQDLYDKLDEAHKKEFIGLPITKKSKIIHIPEVDRSILNQKFMEPDVAIGMVVIEFDGVFWHSLSKEKDRCKDMLYNKYGYKVIRVTDADYKKNPVEVISNLLTAIYN